MRVYVLVRYYAGDEPQINIFGEEAEAWDFLHDYVLNCWRMMGEVEELPSDRSGAIAAYFEYQDDTEWYELSSQEIKRNKAPQNTPQEEIYITPQEQDLLLKSIRRIPQNQFERYCSETGISLGEGSQLIDEVYAKLKD